MFIDSFFIDSSRSKKAQAGFSLLEVLVALAVISLLMGLIGPLSRQSLRMISSTESALAAFAYQNAKLAQASAALDYLNKERSGFEIRAHKTPLAPFVFDVSARAYWQPYLESSEIILPDGRRIMIERIVLMQEGR